MSNLVWTPPPKKKLDKQKPQLHNKGKITILDKSKGKGVKNKLEELDDNELPINIPGTDKG